MSRTFRLAALLFVATALAPVVGQADTVKLAADEWCPYNCAPEAERPGFLIEIAREALKQAGHAVEYTTMPWNRALFENKAGRINGAVGATPGEGSSVFPKETMSLSRNVLVMKPERAKTFTWTGVQSLATIRLGGAQGYSYDQGPIDAYIAGAGKAVELLSGTEIQSQNLRKLLADRVDAVIEDENVIRLAISEIQPRPDLAIIPITEFSPVGIGFSEAVPASRQYADLIDAFIVKARQDGRLKAIYDRYGIEMAAP